MNADRTLLTDSMWTELSPLLPGQAGKCGVTAADTRGFVEAVLWLGRTGVAWRDLPTHLGQWHRVYVRFARWRDKGTWELGVGDGLVDSEQPQDSAFPPPAAPGGFDQRPGAPARHGRSKKNGEQAVGRSRGGNTSKVHMVGDGAGQVLGWQLTAGQAGDAPQAAGLLARWLAPTQQVLGDAAYDSDALQALIAQARANTVIQPNSHRKNLPLFNPMAYKERHRIEQTFSKFKQFRRIATRYDKLDRSFDGFVCLRVISLYLN